jgi:hypothetical protein
LKIAAKRLTHSDASLFEPYFRRSPGSRQKAINLDVEPFTTLFYPALHRTNLARQEAHDVDLEVVGPGRSPPMRLRRKILLQQKNWRLNGAIVTNPADEPDRFDEVGPGDIALMIFEGEPHPTAVRLLLVSMVDPADSAMHAVLAGQIGAASTVVLTEAQLATVIGTSTGDHPARSLMADPSEEADLEDAAQGVSEAVAALTRRARRRGARPTLSSDQLRAARDRAEETGSLGEEMINGLLEAERLAGAIQDFRWVAAENAVAACDFEITLGDGSLLRIDVKTTTGDFRRAFFISRAELEMAAGSAEPYRIYRIHDLRVAGSGLLRRSEDISELARQVLASLDHLPDGVTAEGLAVRPEALRWSEPQAIDLQAAFFTTPEPESVA